MGGIIIKHLKILTSVAIVTIMVCFAELLGEPEIIFPEAAALAMGALINNRQPWNADRLRILVCMAVSASIGWAISSYVNTFLCLKIIVGLFFCLLLLALSRCTLFPLVSACILPIMTNVKSIIYPVSVTVLSAIIIMVQYVMENNKVKQPTAFKPVDFNIKNASKKWGIILFTVALMSFAAEISGALFIIAPPLIVMLFEFMQKNSKPAKNPFIIFFLTGLCACLGTCIRLMFCDMLNLPLTIAALVISILVFYFMSIIHMPFPPACALSLLPLIINEDRLTAYPFEVMIGCAALIAVSETVVKKLYKGV